MNMPPKRYYTIAEVAKICGVTRPSVDRWNCDRPDFPHKVLLGGNTARFRVSDIDGWLANCEAHLDG
ncbi:hypothetical protein BMI86_05850 [Thioclava sp. DLFJ5-1]|uniref:helix-turn-helix transcriptional regulator n=1 Tax=Thioclava sp. DLFJ5-1 TaxID=1915314 RepID=UPI000997ADD9|nr:helix-turn-helix domain-containing protein [Thioclava sp. DLFJ5-1]OOY22049.1 hypothetical protein BMI86_05850 [Thioclava sp. DLFJ5-1]